MNPYRKNEYVEPEAGCLSLRKRIGFALIGLGAGMLCASGIVTTEGCGSVPPAQVVNTIQPSVACAADIITAVNGTLDIAQIAQDCGMTVKDVMAIIEQLLANQPDAGSDAGPGLNDAQRRHLMQLLESGKKALAAGAK